MNPNGNCAARQAGSRWKEKEAGSSYLDAVCLAIHWNTRIIAFCNQSINARKDYMTAGTFEICTEHEEQVSIAAPFLRSGREIGRSETAKATEQVCHYVHCGACPIYRADGRLLAIAPGRTRTQAQRGRGGVGVVAIVELCRVGPGAG